MLARMAYDYHRPFETILALRASMQVFHFDPYRIVMSQQKSVPDHPTFDCQSAYLDSGMFLALSAYGNAHNAGRFGLHPADSYTNGLYCRPSGPVDPGLWDSLPALYLGEPRVIDIHTSIAEGTLEATRTVTTAFYSNLWTLMTTRGLSSFDVIFGEMNPVWLNGFNAAQAEAALRGYKASALYVIVVVVSPFALGITSEDVL